MTRQYRSAITSLQLMFRAVSVITLAAMSIHVSAAPPQASHVTPVRPAKSGGPALRVSAPIVLGVENPGVSLEEVTFVSRLAPAATALRLTVGGRVAMLNSLSQLRGLVHLDTPQQALRFVRLRTSGCYKYDWPGAAIQEVVNRGDSIKYPPSGIDALLSPTAYQRGGFTPTTCEAEPGGFRVRRWVCFFDDGGEHNGIQVQEWVEDIGRDGSYAKTIIKKMRPPRLPGTDWGLTGRK